jgi:hypothetical protein
MNADWPMVNEEALKRDELQLAGVRTLISVVLVGYGVARGRVRAWQGNHGLNMRGRFIM